MSAINYRGLNIPFVSFGNVTSDDLFAPKEQAIFDFYEANKCRYNRALDIGANIGVHTMLMLKQRWTVHAFEPDPVHFEMLKNNVASITIITNRVKSRPMFNYFMRSCMAVSDHAGRETFVRVKGNTTGSHLKGDKEPYGELEEFEVKVVDCRPLFDWADFAKIDCEGHEARILLTVTREQAKLMDFMVEIGNRKNAELIYRHFEKLPTRLWAQKNDWQQIKSFEDMPTHHSHGALFIGWNPPFPTL